MLNDFPYKIRTVFLDFVAEASEIKAEISSPLLQLPAEPMFLLHIANFAITRAGPPCRITMATRGFVCQSWAFDVRVSGISAHSLPAMYVRQVRVSACVLCPLEDTLSNVHVDNHTKSWPNFTDYLSDANSPIDLFTGCFDS